MKQLLSIFALLTAFSAFGQNHPQALNMVQLGNWDDHSLPVHQSIGLVYNSVWGWADAAGKEYAMLGSLGKVHFFDVTDPKNIVLLSEFTASSSTIWREFKMYKDRAYAVCDGCSEGLMIFNVSDPQNITRSYYSNALFSRSHTVTCDTTSGRLYMNGTNIAGSGIAVFDIKADPDSPVQIALTDLTLGANQGGYVHDSYVRNDTIYASHGYGGLVVWDFKNAAAPVALASINTGGYNHASWLTDDGQTMVYAEEVPAGQPLRAISFENLANNEIILKKSFKFPLNAPRDSANVYHNVYIKDNLCYVASYQDGLQVFDIKDAADPRQVAWFDSSPLDTVYKFTTPNGGKTVYAGAWGAYPWLPSGTILVSDMQNGLFTVRLQPTTDAVNKKKLPTKIYPNPFTDMINVDFGDKILVEGNWKLFSPDPKSPSRPVMVILDRQSGVQLRQQRHPRAHRWRAVPSRHSAAPDRQGRESHRVSRCGRQRATHA